MSVFYVSRCFYSVSTPACVGNTIKQTPNPAHGAGNKQRKPQNKKNETSSGCKLVLPKGEPPNTSVTFGHLINELYGYRKLNLLHLVVPLWEAKVWILPESFSILWFSLFITSPADQIKRLFNDTAHTSISINERKAAWYIIYRNTEMNSNANSITLICKAEKREQYLDGMQCLQNFF